MMMDPLYEMAGVIVEGVYRDLSDHLFDDAFLHLGMNDLNTVCWLSSPHIQQYLRSQSITADDLMQILIDDLISVAQSMHRVPIVWDDALSFSLPSSTIIQTSPSSSSDLFLSSINKGYRTLISRGWNVQWDDDWQYLYTAEDVNLDLAHSYPSLAIGGELLLWSHRLHFSQLLNRGWPNAAAVGQKLWTLYPDPNLSSVLLGMEEWRCKAARRGIKSTPLHPDSCSLPLIPSDLNLPSDDDAPPPHVIDDAKQDQQQQQQQPDITPHQIDHQIEEEEKEGVIKEGYIKEGYIIGVCMMGVCVGYLCLSLLRYSKTLFVLSLFSLSFLSSLYLLSSSNADHPL